MIPIFHICWVFGFEISAFINNKIRCEILCPKTDNLHRNIYILLTYSLQVTFFFDEKILHNVLVMQYINKGEFGPKLISISMTIRHQHTNILSHLFFSHNIDPLLMQMNFCGFREPKQQTLILKKYYSSVAAYSVYYRINNYKWLLVVHE